MTCGIESAQNALPARSNGYGGAENEKASINVEAIKLFGSDQNRPKMSGSPSENLK